MFNDSLQRNNELLQEACGIFGMIEEVSLKCRLLKNKAYQTCDLHQHSWNVDTVPESFAEEIQNKVSKMNVDLDRYSYRLKEISEELREINGSIFKMDGT